MADPNNPNGIPVEGEIPRSRDERGERESEEVAEVESGHSPDDIDTEGDFGGESVVDAEGVALGMPDAPSLAGASLSQEDDGDEYLPDPDLLVEYKTKVAHASRR